MEFITSAGLSVIVASCTTISSVGTTSVEIAIFNRLKKFSVSSLYGFLICSSLIQFNSSSKLEGVSESSTGSFDKSVIPTSNGFPSG